jgi:hypothetical protein
VSGIKRRTYIEVVENRVLRRIFGPKREEVTGGWRRLNNDVNNIIRAIKLRRMR